MKQINNKIEISYYLSGSVKEANWENRDAKTEWRENLKREINNEIKRKKMNFDAKVNYPIGIGCDHGGIEAASTIVTQSNQIKNSDIFIAYFDREDLTGTICELWQAVYLNKPILIFLNTKELNTIEKHDYYTAHNETKYFYENTTQTKHYCSCPIYNTDWKISEGNNKLWYLIYLLTLIHKKTEFEKYNKVKKKMPGLIKELEEIKEIININQGNIEYLPNIKLSTFKFVQVENNKFDAVNVREQLRIYCDLMLLHYTEYKTNKQPNNLFTTQFNSTANKLYDEEREYFIINKLIEHNPNKYSKELLYKNNLSYKEKDISKTLYETIERASILENIKVTNYIKEKIAQKLVEITQDAFKDYKEKWRRKEIKDEEVETFLDNHFIREREYQRWTDDELKNLWYLWRTECKRIPDIARLMQRSTKSCEKMIDFIEKYGKKYQNLDNHYKRIITKAGCEQ